MSASPESLASAFQPDPIGRRAFVKGLSTFTMGFACGLTDLLGAEPSTTPRRYAIVDLGGRSWIYQEAILGPYRDVATLAHVMDLTMGGVPSSPRPSSARQDRTSLVGGNFEEILRTKRVDVVIVTLPAALSQEYVVRALDAGCDVITQVGLATTVNHCARILAARQRAGRFLRVAHPYRYSQQRKEVKDLLAGQIVGDLLSVDFSCWQSGSREDGGSDGMGARAHSYFDLLNWWIGTRPLVLRSAVREHIGGAGPKHLQVCYSDGVILSYAERSCKTGFGYVVAFNGTKGRLEHVMMEAGGSEADLALDGFSARNVGRKTSFTPHQGPVSAFPTRMADQAAEQAGMLADLFSSRVAWPDNSGGAHPPSLAYVTVMALAVERSSPLGEAQEIGTLFPIRSIV